MPKETTEERTKFIDRLVEIEPKIKYHYVSGVGIEYCGKQAEPLLIVSQLKAPDEKGNVVWEFHFLDGEEEFYTCKENLLSV